MQCGRCWIQKKLARSIWLHFKIGCGIDWMRVVEVQRMSQTWQQTWRRHFSLKKKTILLSTMQSTVFVRFHHQKTFVDVQIGDGAIQLPQVSLFCFCPAGSSKCKWFFILLLFTHCMSLFFCVAFLSPFSFFFFWLLKQVANLLSASFKVACWLNYRSLRNCQRVPQQPKKKKKGAHHIKTHHKTTLPKENNLYRKHVFLSTLNWAKNMQQLSLGRICLHSTKLHMQKDTKERNNT